MEDNKNNEKILVITALIKSNLHFPVYFDIEDNHTV